MLRHGEAFNPGTPWAAVPAGRAPQAARPTEAGKPDPRRDHREPTGIASADHPAASPGDGHHGRGSAARGQPGDGPPLVRPFPRARRGRTARPAQKRQAAEALSGDQRVALIGLACRGPTDVNKGMTHWSASELRIAFGEQPEGVAISDRT